MGTIDFAIVHHANQYLITNGYENREGLDDLLGLRRPAIGYQRIFELHRAYGVPFNLHLSGTLLEAILWHHPRYLADLAGLRRDGLLDFVGSSYGQNIMRFFRPDHNFRQLNEELALYRDHLGVEPGQLKVFWPPERVWDTQRLAPVLTDKRLLNGGYEHVLIDDRLYYPSREGSPTREAHDRRDDPSETDFHPCRIEGGNGLTALPISRSLRARIPPRTNTVGADELDSVRGILHWLGEANARAACEMIAIYGDDLEKPAGCCGWDEGGPARYEVFLKWLVQNSQVRPVKLNSWAADHCKPCERSIEVGSYLEMSRYFGAGEDYELWQNDPEWERYSDYLESSEAVVAGAEARGADPALLDLAWKHLLASSWETAWHSPHYGVHAAATSLVEPSPWIRATASHSRHAAIIAAAALAKAAGERVAGASFADLDSDGEEEILLGNGSLLAVLSPSRGGRLPFLFDLAGPRGALLIGNPSDDWNWQEELNAYMKAPPNHPGALSELGHQDDRYEATILQQGGEEATVQLVNVQEGSRARGLSKRLRLRRNANEIEVTYELPPGAESLVVEFGFSPDYLRLLRFGRRSVEAIAGPGVMGYRNGQASVWVRLDDERAASFAAEGFPREFGHGFAIAVRPAGGSFSFRIGAGQAGPPADRR